MSGSTVNRVRHGFYLDSVALMRFSRAIANLPGVAEAALMMGSPSNKRIMDDAGLLTEDGRAAGGNDLIVGVRADRAEAAEAALAEAGRLLDRPPTPGPDGRSWRPRTIRAALKSMPDANLALVSVPGPFAAAEARKALRRGLHVMMFSDNVPLADELALKREARERGRLVMGPDCGTAIINGTPLAFANRVPRGDIGIIGASGTGMQEISTLIARGGKGVSQAIGVGGRDLHAEIGGITTLMAIDALDSDPATRHVVLVAKPPSAAVASRIAKRLVRSDKRFTVCFIAAHALELPGNARPAPTLKAAAEDALGGAEIGAGFSVMETVRKVPRQDGRIVGLFSGGTLCAEAQVVLKAGGEDVASNAPVPGCHTLSEAAGKSHRVIDLGADEYTRGRPHPMIEPAVREAPLRDALADPHVGIVLLDVVLGYGAHEDPAGRLARVLEAARDRRPHVVASVTGTEADPQGRSAQIAKLQAAGVLVAPSNAQAAELALGLVQETG